MKFKELKTMQKTELKENNRENKHASRGGDKKSMTVCVKCGLSQDLCVCESIARESQKIIVRIENKKFNKLYTVIEGLNEKEIDLDQLAKKLKERLACGGTVKDDKIE